MFKRKREKIEQERLKNIYLTQGTTCECGFPLMPLSERWREDFGLLTKRIYREEETRCLKCGKKYIKVG